MSNLLPIVNDMIVVVFDLLFYILMFPTKADKNMYPDKKASREESLR